MFSIDSAKKILNISNERINKEVEKICFPNENIIAIKYKHQDGWEHINKYEFAYDKCITFIREKNIVVELDIYDSAWSKCILYCNDDKTEHCFSEGTALEAVFKAFEWTANNK